MSYGKGSRKSRRSWSESKRHDYDSHWLDRVPRGAVLLRPTDAMPKTDTVSIQISYASAIQVLRTPLMLLDPGG